MPIISKNNKFSFFPQNHSVKEQKTSKITTKTTSSNGNSTRHNIKMHRSHIKRVHLPIPQSILVTLLAVSSIWVHLVACSPLQQQPQKQQKEAVDNQQQQEILQQTKTSTTSFSSPSSERFGSSKGAITKITASSIRQQQCREGCLEKFAVNDEICLQNSECLTCWDECAKPPPPKMSKTIRETWTIHTVSMLQQDSLVLVDVAWEPLTMPTQCLVTWEVSGGGLMGNLLTESFNVQLSLWPETKYRVQVTCKNKLTGTMSRSLPLSIDTAEAIQSPSDNIEKQSSASVLSSSSSSKTVISTLQSPATPKLQNTISSSSTSTIDENNLSIDSAAVNSADIEDAGAVLPYDDDEERSSETLNQHTNFVFNWHNRNSGLSTVESVHKPDMNLLTIQMLSNMQKPLLFGVAAGTMLLTLVLLLYVCLVRQQRTLSDKTALITDAEAHAIDANLPPALAVPTLRKAETNCQHAANCSRYALKV